MLSHVEKTANIIFRKLSILQRWITLQHSDILAMCCKVISSFVIFAVLVLRVAEVVLKRRCKLLSFYNNDDSNNASISIAQNKLSSTVLMAV